MNINNEFDIGETVYIITDEEQKPRIITEIRIGPSIDCYYVLSCGTEQSYHYDIEICIEVDVTKLF